MAKNRLQIGLNNKINHFANINTYNKKYCSKCLSVLGEDRVKDSEGNEFCCESCRVDFWRDVRKEFEQIMGRF